MDEFTFRANGRTGGEDRLYQMWRRGASGDLELIDVDFNDYVHPPKGARGRFRLNGWSPHYETNSTFNGHETVVTRTRAEYQIVKLPGNADFEGALFSQQFPVPKNIDNEKSKLGQFISALLNRPIQIGEEITILDFIGTEFVTSVTRDENGDRIYCGIAWDVIDPTKTKLAPTVNGATPELIGAAVGVRSDATDPFEETEEDL